MAEKAPTSIKSDTKSTLADATIEHRIVSTSDTRATSRATSLLFGIKPLLGLYAVMATGAWGFLLPTSLLLSDQVQNLEQDVGRLEGLVDRLSEEVETLEGNIDRYEALNDDLEANNEDFTRQNALFNESNAEYEKQNGRLNASIVKLEKQNDIFNVSNSYYAYLNFQLNGTNQELSAQVDRLEGTNENMTVTVDRYTLLNDKLSNEIDDLIWLNQNLTNQVSALNQSVIDLERENVRFSDLNDDLTTILSFVEEEADKVEETYRALTAYLSWQIDVNRGLIIDRLSLTYQQMTISWICGLQIIFKGQPFMDNPNSPLGAQAYNDVMEVVENDALAPLCLNMADLEHYLDTERNTETIYPIDVALNEIISGVSEYTTLALIYYFPTEGEGLTDDDWVSADYDCENLPLEKKFIERK